MQVGALGVFEKNIRSADEDLLRAGNFSQVPSMDVLKTAKQQYNKKYRLDEDYFKELRMFRFLTRFIDHNSKDVKGNNFNIQQLITVVDYNIKIFDEVFRSSHTLLVLAL